MPLPEARPGEAAVIEHLHEQRVLPTGGNTLCLGERGISIGLMGT